MSDRKRLLTELRVIDLRAELEKRNLDKNGVRGVLVQRLSSYLESEGHDPATYKFELSTTDVKTPAKRKRNQSSIEKETEDAPAMEDMIVQDDAADEDDPENQKDGNTKNDNNQGEDTSMQEESVNNRKREMKDEIVASSPKKPCIKEDDKVLENNDAEDSINLDLGEDELLNEESDNIKPNKKDDVGEDDDAAEDKAAAGESQPGDDGDVDKSTNEEEPHGDTSHDAASSQNNESRNDKDSKDSKENNDSDKKDKKDDGKEGGARNLWVSGLSGDTRAKDLKQLCSKYGKVIGAKVVTNARTPGSRCYGYVTMASSQDAENCIKNLHRTELHGRMISVEKAKSESDATSRRLNSRNDRSSKERKESENKEENKNNTSKEEDEKKKEGDVPADGENKTSKSRERSRTDNKDKSHRSTRSRERRKSPRDVLSFSKIWKEREQARARSRARALREEERRRRAAEEALRERERRQRMEKQRLQHERDKLRQERERIEREKNELLRLERERHRLEREKLELERLELKRAQLRLEEERRKRGYESGSYRKPSPTGFDLRDVRDPRAKRPPPQGMGSSRSFEAPPPPRFEVSNASYDREKRDRDYKRDYQRHMPPTAPIKYPTNGSTADDSRQPAAAGNRPKEPSRAYESRDSRSYRPSPPGKSDARTWNASTRYPDNSGPNKVGDRVARPNEKYSSSSGAPAGEWSSGSYAPPFEQRYSQYQPPPPGAYPDRYQAQREYRKY